MTSYVAFLRGINVGGKRKVSMAALKKAVAGLGFTEIKTVLNSGNLLFTSAIADTDELTKIIQDKLKKMFNFDIAVIVRSLAHLRGLADMNIFEKITVTSKTRLYVTFLPHEVVTSLQVPSHTPDGDFMILHVSPTEVCSVLILSDHKRTTDLMSILEQEFGKEITTRNWNTIEKILKHYNQV